VGPELPDNPTDNFNTKDTNTSKLTEPTLDIHAGTLDSMKLRPPISIKGYIRRCDPLTSAHLEYEIYDSLVVHGIGP
jgi:hypothetical protein